MRVFTLQRKQVPLGAKKFHLDLPEYFKSQDGTGTGKEQNWQQFQHFQIKIIILQ